MDFNSGETLTKGKIAQQTHKHRDGALALRCLYSKRLDTKLVHITAMQEVTARSTHKHTHSLYRDNADQFA